MPLSRKGVIPTTDDRTKQKVTPPWQAELHEADLKSRFTPVSWRAQLHEAARFYPHPLSR